MHESTMIEPNYVSGGARELKASCWPKDRGVLHRRGDWTTERTRRGQESGTVQYQLFTAFWMGDTGDEREREERAGIEH